MTHKEGMRVPGRIVATEKLLAVFDDGVIDPLTNVAMLPGIVGVEQFREAIEGLLRSCEVR